MFLPEQLVGTASHSASHFSKGVVFMSTYEELMVILTIAMLIVAILNYTQKKVAVLLV